MTQHHHLHTAGPAFRYCPQCAAPLVERVAYGKPRLVCSACEFIFFQDPKVVAAVIATRDGKVLLQRRAHEPGKGKWTFPSGHVDAGEAVEAAAVREAREETNAQVRLEGLVGVYSAPGDPVVLIVYEASLLNRNLAVGEEASDLGLFSPEALPELAFPRDAAILRDWLARRGDLASPGGISAS